MSTETYAPDGGDHIAVLSAVPFESPSIHLKLAELLFANDILLTLLAVLNKIALVAVKLPVINISSPAIGTPDGFQLLAVLKLPPALAKFQYLIAIYIFLNYESVVTIYGPSTYGALGVRLVLPTIVTLISERLPDRSPRR